MACRHHDIQEFDGFRCCLACGEIVPDVSLEAGVASNLAAYRYEPLVGYHAIRLVVLFPGQEYEDIHCDIVHANLEDHPAYEAVSYTWATNGDASLSQYIQCQRQELSVTKNCEAALRRLRRQGRNRLLWVDAICIDQANTVERNQQVKAMALIYSSASQVLAYLGPGSPQISPSINRVMDYLDGSLTAWDLHSVGRRADAETFLGLPYFDRVWILQEVGLAKLVTLIAGDREIQWNAITIKKILRLCDSMHSPTPSFFQWVPSSRPEENSLLYALHKSRNCSSTDPRDKVFGVLGLARFEQTRESLVDYTWTPALVFTKTAAHLLELEGLDVLTHASLGGDYVHDPSIPSWVPDWATKNVYESMPTHLHFTPLEKSVFISRWWLSFRDTSQLDREVSLVEDIATCAGDCTISTATWRRLASKRLERLKATEKLASFQDARELGEYMSYKNNTNFQYAVNNCAPTEPGTLKLSGKSVRSCLRIRGHCIGTVVGASHPITEHRRSILPRNAGAALDGARCCSPCADYTLGNSGNIPTMNRREFQDFLQQLSNGYVLFTIEQSMGFTRERPHRGDTVWILSDADFPFILRREGDHFALVGECYIYRAGRAHPCTCCGRDEEPWSMTTEIIDIW